MSLLVEVLGSNSIQLDISIVNVSAAKTALLESTKLMQLVSLNV